MFYFFWNTLESKDVDSFCMANPYIWTSAITDCTKVLGGKRNILKAIERLSFKLYKLMNRFSQENTVAVIFERPKQFYHWTLNV